MNRIILASQSPRRKSLLGRMNVGPFETIPSGFEEILDDTRDVNDIAKELALGKALEVALRFPEAIVVASDTIVVIGTRQLGKACDIDEAREMLIDLSKGPSSVVTGVAVVQGETQLVDVDVTKVYFKPNSPEVQAAREAYLESGDWEDKAGAYGIQDPAAILLFDHIEGNYDTIVGLPTKLLAGMLNEFGIHASPVIYQSPVPQQ